MGEKLPSVYKNPIILGRFRVIISSLQYSKVKNQLAWSFHLSNCSEVLMELEVSQEDIGGLLSLIIRIFATSNFLVYWTKMFTLFMALHAWKMKRLCTQLAVRMP